MLAPNFSRIPDARLSEIRVFKAFFLYSQPETGLCSGCNLLHLSVTGAISFSPSMWSNGERATTQEKRFSEKEKNLS